MIQSKGVFTKQLDDEIQYYLFPQNRKRITQGCLVALSVGLFAAILFQNQKMMMQVGFGMFAILYLYWATVRGNRKISYRRQLKQNPDGFHLTTTFHPDLITVESPIFKETLTIKYSECYKFVELEHCFLIVLVSKPALIVFKEGSEKDERFKNFIMNQKSGINWNKK